MGISGPDIIVGAAVLTGLVVASVRAAARSSDAFLLAGRSLRCWPLGLSLALAGLAPLVLCAGPNEAYYAGLKPLLVPLLSWSALPLVLWCTVPLVHNLELDSVYEYLELRFDAPTRAVGAGLFLFGQVLWMGGVLVLPLTALPWGEGGAWWLLAPAALGTAATLIAWCGGMKGSVFGGALVCGAVALAVLLLIHALASSLDAGLPRVWEVAQSMGRTRLLDGTCDWSVKWSAWAAVPSCALAWAYFFLCDQTVLQRVLAARRQSDMYLSCLLGCTLGCFLLPLAAYVGLGLLAFYHDRAQAEIPPHWVANVARDPNTGRPLIDTRTPIDEESIGRLVADGVILDPNTGGPLGDPEGLVGADGQVSIDRLATRSPRRFGGERLLRSGSDELLSRFVRRHVRFGLAGLVMAAFAGVAVAGVAAGLIAMTNVLTTDVHRRFGWGERWLAQRCGKSPAALDQTDELRLIRPLIVVLGAGAIVVALVVSNCGDAGAFLLGVLGVCAAPLLGAFLLGLFTRRTTAAAAIAGMALGAATGLWAALGHHLAGLPVAGLLWPFGHALGPFWPMPFATGATVAVGCAASVAVGTRKSRDELTGLVVGLGPLGILCALQTAPPEPPGDVLWIGPADDKPPVRRKP